MQFKSDEQRRAVFARLRGGKGGGGQPPKKKPKGYTPPTTGIPGTGPGLDVILADIWMGGPGAGFTPKPNGPGIPGIPAGSSIGTGGAIYGTPASNWFIAPPKDPDYGSYSGPGVGPYQAPTFPNFQPAQTFWGSMYLIVNGVDPNTGDKLPPMGTPGTVKDTISIEFANEVIIGSGFGTNFGINKKNPKFNPAYYGNTGDLSSAWHGQAPKALKKRPWWAK
jgi:hypothetical protein